MVLSYLRVETFPVTNGVSILFTSEFLELTHLYQSALRLSTKHRPAQIATWMRNRSYEDKYLPFIANVTEYSESWIEWWTSCQPCWRQNRGWPLPREGAETTNWVIKVFARGQNGMFLFVVSTAWWAHSIQSKEDWSKFDEVVDDLHWVIGQAIKYYEASPSPAPPAPSTPSNSQDSGALCAAETVRAEGKRRTKVPSRFLE